MKRVASLTATGGATGGLIQDIFELYVERLVACGATPEEAERVVETARDLDTALFRRECPDCGKQILRQFDGIVKTKIPDPTFLSDELVGNYQGTGLFGVLRQDQAWFTYRCSSCPFSFTRVESNEKSS